DELDRRPVVAPARDLIGALCRRRPIVESADEDECGYPRTRHRPATWRIKRSRRPEPQLARWFEQFERVGLCPGAGNPGARREAKGSHALRVNEGLASQEEQSPVGIRSAFEEGGKRARLADLIDTARRIAVDKQDDIAPGDKVAGQFLLCRVMHPGTAVQHD